MAALPRGGRRTRSLRCRVGQPDQAVDGVGGLPLSAAARPPYSSGVRPKAEVSDAGGSPAAGRLRWVFMADAPGGDE